MEIWRRAAVMTEGWCGSRQRGLVGIKAASSVHQATYRAGCIKAAPCIQPAGKVLEVGGWIEAGGSLQDLACRRRITTFSGFTCLLTTFGCEGWRCRESVCKRCRERVCGRRWIPSSRGRRLAPSWEPSSEPSSEQAAMSRGRREVGVGQVLVLEEWECSG